MKKITKITIITNKSDVKRELGFNKIRCEIKRGEMTGLVEWTVDEDKRPRLGRLARNLEAPVAGD